MNRVGVLKDKNILLLQGPMGDFFTRLELLFRKKEANTFRIGFNMADQFFALKDSYIPYRDKKENWNKFISNFLIKNKIDKMFLFGDCRYYQAIAIKEAQKLNIDTFVFEEGYIRPDYVTLEKWGVNNFSLIPRDPDFYTKDIKVKDPIATNPNHLKMIISATVYYIVAYLGHTRYPFYEHHRKLDPYQEAFYGIRNFIRKYIYKFTEPNIATIINKKYYFIPLQTFNDFQIKTHSPFMSIEEFIEVVIKSFSKYAPKDTYLLIKHHPVDRGRKNYRKYIKKLEIKYNIQDKCIVVYDLHLPTLLKHTLGTVTINSTVGIQALYHQSPIKVLGDAIYDINGLTSQKTLDEFWVFHQKPDSQLFHKFRNFLIENTQVNWSFYGRLGIDDI